MPANPLRAFLDVKRRELPLTLLMFTYFFLVIATFWVLKPVKENVFLGYYADNPLRLFGDDLGAAEVELIAKLLNIVAVVFAVIAFSKLSHKLRREQLTFVFGGFIVVCLGAFLAIGPDPEAVKWLFYIFGDLFNTLMVATFFAFLNDSFTPEQAKRTYGPIILGGVVGGAVGSMFVRVQIEQLAYREWLLVAIGATLLIILVAWAAGLQVRKNPPPERAPTVAPEGDDARRTEPAAARKEPSNAALAGASLVARSKYLLSIVAIVGLYEIISQVVDFQFKATSQSLGDPDEARAVVYMWTNIGALILQAFFTSLIFKWIGVRGALLILPLLLFGFSSAYLIIPIWAVVGVMRGADNALNYSINQSAKEALYTVTSREEKYKAKAFIDMFVQRFAKGLAIGVTLLITVLVPEGPAGTDVDSGVRWTAIIAIAGAAIWIFAARYAGKRFKARAEED